MTYSYSSSSRDYSDEEFYAVIDCLKNQQALPQDSFIRQIPFFNFASLTKEFQLKELFQGCLNQDLYKAVLKDIIIIPENSEDDLSRSNDFMMNFAQIVFYKVLPCPDANCIGRPREIVTHNQYKDNEFECPFYHHERDRRRIVIAPNLEGEFAYKANYFEEGRSQSERTNYSQNYFESMFHPLYYKMFRCKREHCDSCRFCPFYHHEQEKKNWDRMFNLYLKKDRITYVKDKQKYLESTSQSSSENSSPTKDERQLNPRRNNNKYHKNSNNSTQIRNTNFQAQNDVRNGAKRGNFSNKNYDALRKGSDDAFGLNIDSAGLFGSSRQFVNYRAC